MSILKDEAIPHLTNTNGNATFSKLQSLSQVSLNAMEKLSLMQAQPVKFPGPGKKMTTFFKRW